MAAFLLQILANSRRARWYQESLFFPRPNPIRGQLSSRRHCPILRTKVQPSELGGVLAVCQRIALQTMANGPSIAAITATAQISVESVNSRTQVIPLKPKHLSK
jgi:hypothetical protein